MIEFLMSFLCGLPMTLIWLAGFIFWVWVLVDCLTKEPSQGNEKLIWVLVVVFVQPLIGPLIYFFIRRPERIRLYGR
jgi:hypothetical protein